MMKIGCGTVLFRKYALEDALKAIRDAGFEYFETQAVGAWCPHVDVYRDDPADLLALKRKYGFKGITALWTLDGSLIANDKCVESGRRSIEWAEAAEIPIVHIGEGFKPKDMSEDEAFKRIEDRINELTAHARTHGVKLAVEPHGTYSLTMNGLLKIISYGDPDTLGVNYDAANVFRSCFVDSGNADAKWQKIESREDEVEVLKAVIDRVVHMHVKDLNADRKCVAVGSGLVKIRECIGLLKEHGYDGAVSVETEGDDSFREAADLARKSYVSLLEMIGE